VTGVDFAPAMVEAARREAARRGVAAEFREADLRRVDEASGSLAAVHFTYDVYSFLPSREDRIALLRRMRGWLEPGGVILLSARRVRGGWARLVLLAQALSTRRGSPRTWGASHTRWLDPSGGLHRSFVQVFGERMIRREVDAAGLEAENWEGGHVLLRPVADLPAGRGRTSGE
jgi:SAM-dependent methyltransferase